MGREKCGAGDLLGRATPFYRSRGGWARKRPPRPASNQYGVKRLAIGSPASHRCPSKVVDQQCGGHYLPRRTGPRSAAGARILSADQAVMQHPPPEITRLLQQWSDGDRRALDRLIPRVYDQLRRLAHHRLRSEDGALSLGTTALVHELYLKLVDLRTARFRDRAHFLAMASRLMRRLLVDHARARKAAKRGGGVPDLVLDEALDLSDGQVEMIAELDDALLRLERMDERQSSILEHRYFGGLTLEETAEVVGVSLATVKRELRCARAWLAAELSAELEP
jgi:RNA polymerase sigma factor (TIGR02999 family)